SGFAAGFSHPQALSVPLFLSRFFCSWVTAWVKTLSRWDPEDRILHTEFNDNWDKIDTALKSSAEAVAADTALRTAIAACGNCEVICGTYTGDGTGSKTLTFSGIQILHTARRRTGVRAPQTVAKCAVDYFAGKSEAESQRYIDLCMSADKLK
ncbi:MAG: hypothetical protein ACLR58_15035, partial [Eubacteriales bacterium]